MSIEHKNTIAGINLDPAPPVSGATRVENDDRTVGTDRQLEQAGDGVDNPILGGEEALLDASDFTHGVFSVKVEMQFENSERLTSTAGNAGHSSALTG